MAPDGSFNPSNSQNSQLDTLTRHSSELPNITMDKLVNLLAERLTPILRPLSNPNPTNHIASVIPQAAPVPANLAPATSSHSGSLSELDAFVPPISQNPAAGMSFDRMFYDVDSALRLAIAKHEFKPEHLWKLDDQPARKQVKSKSFEIDDEGIIVKHEKSATIKDYPNPRSLVDPLIRYFLMLQIYVAHSAGLSSAIQVMYHTNEYLRLLQKLISEYDWAAVLHYHFNFHAIQLIDMREGRYYGWSSRDRNLWSKFLDGHIKTPHRSSATNNAKQTCFSSQTGKFTSPCPQGRLHICKNCKSEVHGISEVRIF